MRGRSNKTRFSWPHAMDWYDLFIYRSAGLPEKGWARNK